MLIAQITDFHIRQAGLLAYGRVDTAACLARAIARLADLDPRPDAVVATGDLVDAGDPLEYAHLRRLLAPLASPLYVLPGNHDSRPALREAFRDHGYLPAEGDFLHYAVEDWPLRLIGLDTTIPAEPGGRLCERRLAWLDAKLAEQPERPTLLMMHHPPMPTGIGHMDVMGLEAPARLAAVLRRHAQVERIICGHIHRSIQAVFAGRPVSIAPSTAHQVALDLRDGGAARYVLEPPGFHLHLWRPGSGLVTHNGCVDDFPGPFAFHD
jgi:3',5'-cyclic-AMP phosphodiesterase